MQKRTVLLFSIFIFIAVVGVALITYYLSKNNQIVKDYVEQITVCGNIIDEEDCYSRDFCQGIYAPTCPTCQSVEFQKCVKIEGQSKDLLAAEKTICESTSGVWYRNRLGSFCICDRDGMNKKFEPEKGCVEK